MLSRHDWKEMRGTGEMVRITYLAHVIVHTPTRHKFKHNAEVGFPRAGAYELDYILMSNLPHYGHLLKNKQPKWNVQPCKGQQ